MVHSKIVRIMMKFNITTAWLLGAGDKISFWKLRQNL